MNDQELKKSPPVVFDNTMLATWCRCPRLFYWFMRRLDLKVQPAYFAWGRAFGAGINEWHALQGKAEHDLRIARMLKAAREEWDKDLPEEFGDNTLENLENTLILYTMIYGEEENWTMPYGMGELGFKFPLGEINGKEIYYAGSMDAPIEWEGYGLLAREDKTTGGYINTKGVDPELIQYDDASQVTGYAWALRQLTGEVPMGVLMNIVSKKKRKEPELRFSRYLVSISQWDLDRFIRDTLRIVEDIYREWERWDWPLLGRRDPINCVGGKGRTACIYRRLCHAEMEPWELETFYNFDEAYVWRPKWEPWEREGKNE